jgi:hypothetical protein
MSDEPSFRPLTKRQRQIYAALGDELWKSPSAVGRLAGMRGWTTRENAMAHLRALERLGLAERRAASGTPKQFVWHRTPTPIQEGEDHG